MEKSLIRFHRAEVLMRFLPAIVILIGVATLRVVGFFIGFMFMAFFIELLRVVTKYKWLTVLYVNFLFAIWFVGWGFANWTYLSFGATLFAFASVTCAVRSITPRPVQSDASK